MELPWKGNIRELENLVKHILVVAEEPVIQKDDVAAHFAFLQGSEYPVRVPAEATSRGDIEQEPGDSPPRPIFDGYTWERLERAYVSYLLEKNRWNVTRASREAGVNRSTFDSRLRKLGIRK